ncbi:MAG: hypothetical protein NTU44_14265 [Bacteroidetes bacterium]|nr:hypothetical protein [Bacteroidota bacterium]
MGKAYKSFMFLNDPPKEFLKELNKDVPPNLQASARFITQTLTSGKKILSNDFLVLPDPETLKNIYIIDAINQNVREEKQVDNLKLIDSLKKKDIPRYELVDNYYNLLFTAVGNKLKPFNLSKVNFTLKEYGLKDDTEKGIFFLRCIDYCGTEIWGFMNIVKPHNIKKAYQYIRKFPKFNGLKYYQYNDLSFPDFEMVIITKRGPQSYKGFFIDRYYELLLSHLTCLNGLDESQKDINDLLLGSILRDQSLYKYTKYKERLEGIFQEQKRE